LYILADGNAFVGTPISPVSGMITVTGGPKTKGIWAQVSSNATSTLEASVTYNGPGITATGGSDSSVIEACVNDGCGNPGTSNGNAIINATGNFTIVGGPTSTGLKANSAGTGTCGTCNGTATVNFNGGTINVTGGGGSTGIFASATEAATITTQTGTTIIVNSTSLSPSGIQGFSDGGAATRGINNPGYWEPEPSEHVPFAV
jgi:hypothetical protein